MFDFSERRRALEAERARYLGLRTAANNALERQQIRAMHEKPETLDKATRRQRVAARRKLAEAARAMAKRAAEIERYAAGMPSGGLEV